MKNNGPAYIAVVDDAEGNPMAVRFPSMDALIEWEERTGVFVAQTLRLATRAEAVKVSRA